MKIQLTFTRYIFLAVFRHKSAWLVVACVFLNTSFFSQDYSYKDYLSDRQILKKSNRFIRENKIDSLKTNLQVYKDRLGYTYYQFKALVANSESDSSGYKYLDSAFMGGMTPLCLGKHLKHFDTAYVYKSFRKNYLKFYDIDLINLVDSLHYRDQHYRRQMSDERRLSRNTKPQKKEGDADDSKEVVLKNGKKELNIDLLWRLQSITDSLNFEMLNKIIADKGWPSAKLLGDHYCQRPAADVTILVVHLGTRKREYQVATLKTVIDLCKRQEESWGNALTLLSNLHKRFKTEFSEFSFLNIENNHINAEESFFSIHTMVNTMVSNPSEKIQIRCKEKSLYTELKEAMLAVNIEAPDQAQIRILKELKRPLPGPLNESSFEFIESPALNDNVVLYKMVQK